MDNNFIDEFIELLKKEKETGIDYNKQIDKIASLDDYKKKAIYSATNEKMLNFYDAVKKYDSENKYYLQTQLVENERNNFLNKSLMNIKDMIFLASEIYIHNDELNKLKIKLKETDKSSEQHKKDYKNAKNLVTSGNQLLSKYREMLLDNSFKKTISLDDFSEFFFKSSSKDLLLKSSEIINFAKLNSEFKTLMDKKEFFDFFQNLKKFLIKIISYDIYYINPPKIEDIMFGLFDIENIFNSQNFIKRWESFYKNKDIYNYDELLKIIEKKALTIFANSLCTNSIDLLQPNNFNGYKELENISIYLLNGKHFHFFTESFNKEKALNSIDSFKIMINDNKNSKMNLSFFDDDNYSVCSREIFIKGGKESLILGYQKIEGNNLIQANTTEFQNEVETNSELLSPRLFSKLTKNYSCLKFSKRKQPDFIVCFDNINKNDIFIAKNLNLPILMIKTQFYTKPRQFTNAQKIYFNNTKAYLICSNKSIKAIKNRKQKSNEISSLPSQHYNKKVEIVEIQNLNDKIIKNKQIAIQKLKEDIKNYKLLSDELKCDNEILDYVFSNSESAELWEYVPLIMKSNKDFIKRMLTLNPFIYLQFSSQMMKNKSYLITLIKERPSFFPNLPDYIKNNPYLISEIIKANPEVYKYLSDDLKSNPMILKKIIEYSQGYNWEFIDDIILNNPSLIEIIYLLSPRLLLQILKRHPSLILNCPQYIIDDSGFMQNAITLEPEILKYPWENDNIRNALFLVDIILLNMNLLNFAGQNIQSLFEMKPKEQLQQESTPFEINESIFDFSEDFENFNFFEDEDNFYDDENFNDDENFDENTNELVELLDDIENNDEIVDKEKETLNKLEVNEEQAIENSFDTDGDDFDGDFGDDFDDDFDV